MSKAGWCYEVIEQKGNRVRCSPLELTLSGRYWSREQLVFPTQQLTIITSPVSTNQELHRLRQVVATPVKSSEQAEAGVELIRASVGVN